MQKRNLPTWKSRARLTCSGGLYLEVSPAGSKRWFWKYRKNDKEGRMALGSYPDVGAKDARKARDAAKSQKSDGRDPVMVRKVEKLKALTPAGDTFKATALEWYEMKLDSWSSHYAIREKRNLEKDLFPYFAARRIGNIEPTELLAAVRQVEERGALDVAHRVLITEFDLDAALWTIPAARMKRSVEGKKNGAPHLVPLPAQAVAILRKLHPITGHGTLLFHGERSHDQPISDNTLRAALLTLGYGPDVQSVHGFRATARTMLAEIHDADPLVIEAQLAHAVKDANGRAYNRTTYMQHRATMMQQWADYLDKLATGGEVIQLKAA